MTHPTPRPDPIDSFTDWLDAGGPGMVPPVSTDASDADLADICRAAHQLHDLDVGFQQYAATVSARSRITHWEDIMQHHPALATSSAVPVPPIPRPIPERRPDRFRRSWQVAINATLAAVLILGLGIGLWREFGPSAPLPWQDGSPGNPNGLLPAGTPAANDTASSSFPYPAPSECTATPLTKEQVRAHFEAANNPALTPTPFAVYSESVYPSAADTEAIMATYRMWQACLQVGPILAQRLALETPEFTATMMGRWFFDGDGYTPVDKRPISEDAITCLTDLAMVKESEQHTLASCVPQFFPASTPEAMATPEGHVDAARTVVPLPKDATPLASPTGGGRAFPTIFATDISLYGPDRAIAQAYWVNEYTGEISYLSPKTIKFVKVDGHWLIDYQRDGGIG